MMVISELRIGNYVEYNGYTGIVSALHSPVPCSDKEYNDIGLVELVLGGIVTARIDEINPIPLTEDLLLKLGFSDKEYKDGYIGIDINSDSITTDFVLTKPLVMGEFQKSFSWEYRAGNIPFFKQIKFLHRLQNLYYSLTGEELEIKK